MRSIVERMRCSLQPPGSLLVSILTDEIRYKLLKLLASNPSLSQREVASTLGISLGKVNYCIRALAAKGWIKAANFKNSNNKAAYVYVLTPRGLEERARVTTRFLQAKMQEYELLIGEIAQIRDEAERQSSTIGLAARDTTHDHL